MITFALVQCESTSSGPSNRVKDRVREFAAKLMTYHDLAGRFPTEQQGLAALAQRPTIEPIPAKWKAQFRKIPNDPWGRSFEYRIEIVNGMEVAYIRCLGLDPDFNHDDVEIRITR